MGSKPTCISDFVFMFLCLSCVSFIYLSVYVIPRYCTTYLHLSFSCCSVSLFVFLPVDQFAHLFSYTPPPFLIRISKTVNLKLRFHLYPYSQVGRLGRYIRRLGRQVGWVDRQVGQIGRLGRQVGQVGTYVGQVDRVDSQVGQIGRLGRYICRLGRQVGWVDRQVRQMHRLGRQVGQVDRQIGRLGRQVGQVDRQVRLHRSGRQVGMCRNVYQFHRLFGSLSILLLL